MLRIPPSVGAGSFDMPRLRSMLVSYVELLNLGKLDCHWFVARVGLGHNR